LQAIYWRIKPSSAYGFILNPDAERYEPRSILTNAEESRLISPDKISSIAVLGNAQLSSAALRLAAESGIPFFIHHPQNGKAEVRMDSIYFHNLAEVRRQQILFALDAEATQWLISLFQWKQVFQNENLDFLARRKTAFATEIERTKKTMQQIFTTFEPLQTEPVEAVRLSIMGLEGNIARLYWKSLAVCLADAAVFEGRSRRPATDPFNTVLNYAYGMLYTVVERAILAVGLDPQLGFLHVDEYQKPTFVFDFIEPFRPWIDRMCLEAFLKKEVRNAFFEGIAGEDNGILLSKAGKNGLIPKLNDYLQERIRFKNHLLSRQNHIFRAAGEFAQRLKTFKSAKI
jgi:CRISPR-associated protein Cas1